MRVSLTASPSSTSTHTSPSSSSPPSASAAAGGRCRVAASVAGFGAGSASSGATALETGPQESALLLGGAVLTEVGVPTSEVVTIIDDARSRMYASKIDGYEQAVEEIQRSRFALFKKRQAEEEAEAEEEAAAASKMRLMSAPTPEAVDPSAPTSEIVEDGDALVVVEAAAPEAPQPIVDFVVAREEPDRDDAPSPKA